jgi:hypothetical protein
MNYRRANKIIAKWILIEEPQDNAGKVVECVCRKMAENGGKKWTAMHTKTIAMYMAYISHKKIKKAFDATNLPDIFEDIKMPIFESTEMGGGRVTFTSTDSFFKLMSIGDFLPKALRYAKSHNN